MLFFIIQQMPQPDLTLVCMFNRWEVLSGEDAASQAQSLGKEFTSGSSRNILKQVLSKTQF